MLKQLEGARLGLFIFLGTILLVLSIFLIGNKESMFVTSIYIKTYFPSVEGLRSGAPVRLSGLDIGTVSDIVLVNDTTSRVEVNMRINKELRHFIRLDSKAYIETEGLVGKKIISITPGSNNQEIVKDGGIIESRTPVSMTEIIEETQSAIGYVKEMTKDFSEIVAKINKGDGTIGKIINDNDLYNSTVKIIKTADQSLKLITSRLDEITLFISGLGGNVESILSNVDSTVGDIKYIIQTVQNGQGVLGALIADRSAYDSIKIVISNLVQTTEAASYGTRAFAENMEALKHNWLFKKYFEDRGYWSEADYQKEIDGKISELNKQNSLLEMKIEELKQLERQIDAKSKKQNE